MSLTPLPLQQGMSYADLINALNQNFAMLQDLTTSQTFKDETGTNRIIIGRFPNGNWGIIISKPGIDVLQYDGFQ